LTVFTRALLPATQHSSCLPSSAYATRWAGLYVWGVNPTVSRGGALTTDPVVRRARCRRVGQRAEMPAGGANGTVNPSGVRITTSRTVSLPEKWSSVCCIPWAVDASTHDRCRPAHRCLTRAVHGSLSPWPFYPDAWLPSAGRRDRFARSGDGLTELLGQLSIILPVPSRRVRGEHATWGRR